MAAFDGAFGCLFHFDEHVGPTMGWTETCGSDEWVEDVREMCDRELGFVCLPENTSSIADTALSNEATLLVCVTRSGQCVFGASVMVSERAEGSSRCARQEAVCVLCAYPAFDVLETRARALASVSLGEREVGKGREVLEGLRSRCKEPSSSGDFAASVSCRQLAIQIGCDNFVRALHVAIAGGRLAFFSRKSSKASRAVLAVASALPAFLSLGLSRSVSVDLCPTLGAHSFRWKRHGFPIELVAVGNMMWAPAVAMATAADLLLVGDGMPRFCIGTCNAMVARRLADERRADAVIDLDDGVVEPGASPLFAGPIEDRASVELLQDINKALGGQHNDNGDWFGSDAWLRARCEIWLSRTLRALIPFREGDTHALGQRLFSRLIPRRRQRDTTWLSALAASPAVSLWLEEHGQTEPSATESDETERAVGRYQGETDELGRKHGRGTLSFGEGSYYRGEWARDKRNGYGVSVHGDRQYEGQWVDDIEHGEGTLTLQGSLKYKGYFEHGKFAGFGTLTTDSTLYRGEFVAGLFEGAGSFESREYRHVGEWERGLRHGVGHTEYLRDGSVASGTWEADCLQEGTLTRTNGILMRGTFDAAGRLHGDGSLTTAEGDSYEGPFDSGEMRDDASFTVRYVDGRRYAGQLRDGVPSGRGVCRYENGDVYDGEFLDGLRSGVGSLVVADSGCVLAGKWRCDIYLGASGTASAAGHELSPITRGRGDSFLFDGDEVEDLQPEDALFDNEVVHLGNAGQSDASRIRLLGSENAASREDNARVAAQDSTLQEASVALRDDEVTKPPRQGVARVRYSNGDVYEGEFWRGARHGNGIYTEATSGHSYDGVWVRGKRHGRGTFTSGDGSFAYDGQYTNGRREGFGVAKLRRTCSYAGEWRDDVFHGSGVLVDSCKNAYEGEFADGIKHGVGTQTYADGTKYVGEWREGYRSGTGHCDSADGTTYTGTWRTDRAHGHGTICRTKCGKQLFDGCFEKGLKHGWGVEFDAQSGASREGEWLHGEPRLDAEWTIGSPGGSTYVGPVNRSKSRAISTAADLKPHGKAGILKYANGDTYSGSFVDGKRDGYGIAVFKNGEQFEGDWHDDHIALGGHGTLRLKDGTVHVFSRKNPLQLHNAARTADATTARVDPPPPAQWSPTGTAATTPAKSSSQ